MANENVNAQEVFEYRGIDGLVYAPITEDSEGNYTTGEVKPMVPIAELSKSRDSSSDTHYYDNKGLITVNSDGDDEVKINASGIPLEVLADITGQIYYHGALIETSRDIKQYAIGYRTSRTDNKNMLVWRNKGTFEVPEEAFKTRDDGTDAEGQEITFKGVETIHRFEKANKKGSRAVVVPEDGEFDTTDFFKTVQTPDTLKLKTEPAPGV